MNSLLHTLPNSDDKDDWNSYIKLLEHTLGRKLTKEEFHIIYNVKFERYINSDLSNLTDILKTKKMFVPVLTDLDGNCLFESIKYYKLFDDHIKFREDLSCLMMLFKNYKNFFPNQPDSLNDLFVPF